MRGADRGEPTKEPRPHGWPTGPRKASVSDIAAPREGHDDSFRLRLGDETRPCIERACTLGHAGSALINAKHAFARMRETLVEQIDVADGEFRLTTRHGELRAGTSCWPQAMAMLAWGPWWA